MTRRSVFPVSRQVLGLVGWLALTAVAAALGAIASSGAASFYATLEQPSWAPPAGVFGPVWTFLYVTMAVAAWLVWRVGGFLAARAALALYIAQLALNALWSWLFFAWRLGAGAFVEVLVLWAMLVVATVSFWRVRPLAGVLLAPYVLWVSFAATLNFALWRMNPESLG
jgi:benzodiazapine receptor